jgi:hypothetical protein
VQQNIPLLAIFKFGWSKRGGGKGPKGIVGTGLAGSNPIRLVIGIGGPLKVPTREFLSSSEN